MVTISLLGKTVLELLVVAVLGVVAGVPLLEMSHDNKTRLTLMNRLARITTFLWIFTMEDSSYLYMGIIIAP